MAVTILIRWYLIFFSYELSDIEKSVLCKDLNFSVKPKLIEYLEFLLLFELLFRDVKQENLCSEDFSLMKARLLDTGLPSYESFSSDQSPSENLTASEFKALTTKILWSTKQIRLIPLWY